MVDMLIKYLSRKTIPQKQKVKDGKQYFILLYDLVNVAESNLIKHNFNL